MALKGRYTSEQRRTKQGSYRLYKKYKEAVIAGDMDKAEKIHAEGVKKYKEDFHSRYHGLNKKGKYGEMKTKNIKYG